MSTNRGSLTRTRPQKYQNRTAFKNDLHDKTPKIKLLNSLQISEVCDRCKAIIEWKIKYKTYKPLKKPKTCVNCHRKSVRMSYHSVCSDCAQKKGVCAKCLKSAEEVAINQPQPDEKDEKALKAEMAALVKSMSERKRRSFSRFMNKGKGAGIVITLANSDSQPTVVRTVKSKEFIPYTRLELINKIAELNAAAEETIPDSSDSEDESFDYDETETTTDDDDSCAEEDSNDTGEPVCDSTTGFD